MLGLNQFRLRDTLRATGTASMRFCAWLSVAFALNLAAQDAATLTNADYFWDVDRVTNHVPIAISSDETMGLGYPSAQQLNINLSGLSSGGHQLGFRVQNEAGVWSDVNWLPVQVCDATNVSAATGNVAVNDSGAWRSMRSISGMLRRDPAMEFRSVRRRTRRSRAGYPSALTNVVDLSSLTPGPHQLGFRTMDNQGRVSATSWLPVQVYDPTNITAATGNVERQ